MNDQQQEARVAITRKLIDERDSLKDQRDAAWEYLRNMEHEVPMLAWIGNEGRPLCNACRLDWDNDIHKIGGSWE